VIGYSEGSGRIPAHVVSEWVQVADTDQGNGGIRRLILGAMRGHPGEDRGRG